MLGQLGGLCRYLAGLDRLRAIDSIPLLQTIDNSVRQPSLSLAPIKWPMWLPSPPLFQVLGRFSPPGFILRIACLSFSHPPLLRRDRRVIFIPLSMSSGRPGILPPPGALFPSKHLPSPRKRRYKCPVPPEEEFPVHSLLFYVHSSSCIAFFTARGNLSPVTVRAVCVLPLPNPSTC